MISNINIIKLSKIYFIFITLLILPCCGDDEEYYVPDVPVNIELNLTNELLPLGVGETLLIVPDHDNDGFGKIIYADPKMRNYTIPWRIFGNGVLIYRSNLQVYEAYDRTCTYKAFEDNCGIEIKENMLLPKCACCGSKFMVTANGVATRDSKAERALLPLQTRIENNGTRLIITKMF